MQKPITTEKEKLVQCPECNGGGLHTSGEGKCYYCSGTIMIPEESYLYTEKERRRAKKLVRLAFEADKKYNKKECLKMNYEELMDFYCMGAELPTERKDKYIIEIAFYKKDDKICMAAGIFKGDKMIYYIRKRWKVMLLIRIVMFFRIKACSMSWDGAKSTNREQIIKRHESTN